MPFKSRFWNTETQMSANPETIAARVVNADEIERLLQQRELLDATELIAAISVAVNAYRKKHKSS